MKLKDLINEEKPREKLINNGPGYLSDSELLSIILRVGDKDNSVNEISNNLLKKYGSIGKLSMCSYNSLIKEKGIKKSKASSLLAAFEISRRINKTDEKIKLSNAVDIYNYFKYDFLYEKQENFYCILFDTKMNYISKKKMFVGTVDSVNVHPREIFKYAISESASFFVVMHNHPSGDVTPSSIDIDITNRLYEASKIIGIKMVDHIIISSNSFYSFYEESKNMNI